MNRRIFATLVVVAILAITAVTAHYVSLRKYIVSYEILCYDAESDYWYYHDSNCNRAVSASSKDDMIYKLYDIESELNTDIVVDSIHVKSYVIVK